MWEEDRCIRETGASVREMEGEGHWGWWKIILLT